MSDKTVTGNSSSVHAYVQGQFPDHFGDNSVADAATVEPQTKPERAPFPRDNQVSINAKAGEDPRELHRRILLEAASQAGLDGTSEQQRFVEQFIGGLKFTEKTSDPSPLDNKTVKSADLKNESLNYNLSPEEIAALRQLQKDYRSRGGTLRAGKVYDYSTEGRTLTAGEIRNGKRGITAEQYERWRMQDLMQKAQIIPGTFGLPAKLRDLKHITLNAPDAKPIDHERALRLYIESRFGAAHGGNLWGDKLNEITQLAMARGVRVENLEAANGKIEFDISVENLLKLQHAYIGVQEKFNADMKIVNETIGNLPHNRFAKGVFEGAWDALKANWKAISNPVQTIKDIYEAAKTLGDLGVQLAQMKPEERAKLFADLAQAGVKGLAEMPIADAAEHLGRAVGTLAVEIALGKGVGLVFRALSLTKFGASLASKARALSGEIKQTVGNLPIPTSADIKIVVDTAGNKMMFPDIELTKLEDLIKPLESRAQNVLSGGKAINLPAWSKLSFKLEADGETIHLINNHTVTGKGYQSSLKMGGKKDVFPANMTEKQILRAVREAYENSKKVETQEFLGEKRVRLIGESNGMKIEMWINLTNNTLETAYPITR